MDQQEAAWCREAHDRYDNYAMLARLFQREVDAELLADLKESFAAEPTGDQPVRRRLRPAAPVSGRRGRRGPGQVGAGHRLLPDVSGVRHGPGRRRRGGPARGLPLRVDLPVRGKDARRRPVRPGVSGVPRGGVRARHGTHHRAGPPGVRAEPSCAIWRGARWPPGTGKTRKAPEPCARSRRRFSGTTWRSGSGRSRRRSSGFPKPTSIGDLPA